MKKLRIGVLTEIINYHSGARAPLMIAKGLVKRGHKVTVFAYDFMLDQLTFDDLKKSGIEIIFIKKKKVKYIGKYLSSISLFKSLKKNPPEAILFSGTLPFFLAGKLLGIPIIWMYMGTQFDALLENTIPNQGISFIAKTFNAVVNVYIYLVGFIIYLGTTFFQKHNTKTLRKKDYISLLSISRITPYKGFHLVIEAIKKVKVSKKIILMIVGSQPKEKYLAYLKKIGGKNIRIIIDPPDQELARLYQNSDIYVTADRYLYFGLPIFEATQFGTPTVSLNFAAANELIVHGKTGFVANNLDEFSYYLQKLIADEKLRKMLGYNALQWSKTFSWEECARKWEKLLIKYAK